MHSPTSPSSLISGVLTMPTGGHSHLETYFCGDGRSDDDPSAPTSNPLDRGATKVRIVVADDDDEIRASLRALLQAHGYSVLEASNGDEALHHVRQGGVDLVITDIFMPEKEGLETIQILRREHRTVGIVAISEAGEPHYLKMARTFGAAATLTKPVQAQPLLNAVANVLQEAKTK